MSDAENRKRPADDISGLKERLADAVDSLGAIGGSERPNIGGESRPAGIQTGLKALAAVARHLGLDWSMERLLHAHANEYEPTAERLAEIARLEGMRSSVRRCDWVGLQALRRVTPFLARTRGGTYVVVIRTPEEGEPGQDAETSVTVYNPRTRDPKPFPVPRSLFEEHWTGEIVLLKRIYKLADTDRKFGLGWFVPEFWRQRGVFSNVIIAALTMQVLALVVPIFFQVVIDKVVTHFAVATLTVITIGVVIALAFDAIMNWLRGFFILRGSARIDIRLARRSFRHLTSLPLGFFDHARAGVITRHMQQGAQIREFLTGRLLTTLLDLPSLVLFLPVLAYYSVPLTLVVLAVTLLLGAIIAFMIGPYRRRLRRLYAAEATRQSHLVETIHGIRTVKSLNLEPRRQESWDNAAADAVRNYVEVGKISLAASAMTQFIERGMTVTIVVSGAFLVFSGHLTVGALVAFNMLSARVTGPVLQLIGLLNNYQEALMSVDMLGEIMNRPVESNVVRGLTPPIRGDLELKNVTFRYPGSEQPALQSFSARIPAGALVGIVGRSGSGKTTLSALLQGLYTTSDGAILVDGHNIKDIDLAYLRGQTGVVPQEPFLFRGSVKENIRLGRPTATFEDVVEAARLAGADSFIDELPQRYDTELEEGATNLSGGQKQRLSIARALLRHPRILIFDEATSALDPESEAIVIKNLTAIAKGRTTIVISHRLQTIRGADMILVIDAGRLADVGTHGELINRNLIYRQLWTQQMDKVA